MNNTTNFLKGTAIGAAMSIPGISGGTMAIIFGIYEKLLWSVGNILKEPKKCIPFLLSFTLGGVAGLLLTARLVSFILSTPAGIPLQFAFFGAATGCIPPILKRAEFRPLTPTKLVCLISGMACAVLISIIPSGVFSAPSDDLSGFITKLLSGVIIAIALVLPGISASQMLYVLGIYDQVMGQIAKGEFFQLLPLAIGLLLGIFITSKVLTSLLDKFKYSYIVVLGFMIYSLTEMIPKINCMSEFVIGTICAVIGFILSFILSSKENHDILSKNT